MNPPAIDGPHALHATCVDVAGVGVLIRGRPGAGKSTLALTLIDELGVGLGTIDLRTRLVADDQTLLERQGTDVLASPPASLVGLLEVRGAGLLRVAHSPQTRLRLVVDLLPGQAVERLPLGEDAEIELLGVTLARVAIAERNPAATSVVRAVVSTLLNQLPHPSEKA
jgi:HPr kinase/phosphorylase